MIKLELDWAGDELPELGVEVIDGEATGIVIEYAGDPSVAGWPAVRVWATDGQTLWHWLRNEYCAGDGDEASELASMAS